MKVLDVNQFEQGLERNLNRLTRLESEMKQIETAIQGLTNLEESLKGQGGEALRAFYENCHIPFLEFFQTFKSSFTTILQQMDSALTSLEPDATGYIRQESLEGEIEQGLEVASQVTEDLTNETNQIMSTVSDIVSLPNLDDSEVQAGVLDAKSHRDQTVQQLNVFDATQTTALNTIQTDLLLMKTWITNIESMMKEGVTDVNFPAEQWKAFAIQHPLQILLNFRSSPLLNVARMNNTGLPGTIFGTAPYSLSSKLSYESLFFNYSKDGMNVVPTSANMKFEEELSCPAPGQEKTKVNSSEAQAFIKQSVGEVEVIDEIGKGEDNFTGTYYTLPDGRILRKYYGKSDIEYEFVSTIPNERIGGVKLLEDEVPAVKVIDDIVKTLFIDDIEMVLDPEASNWEKGVALGGMLPIGKITKVDDLLKLRKIDGVNDMENIAKKSDVDKMVDKGKGNKSNQTPDVVIRDGSHKLKDGTLKPNVKYKAGEYEYLYETDNKGRLKEFNADDLNLTEREKRLPHNPNTPGKEPGDHAGHIAADRFGGSPDLDNLVSQSSNVNLSKYKKLENQWAKAIDEGKHVSVNVKINYEGNSSRPSSFDIEYEIDGRIRFTSIEN